MRLPGLTFADACTDASLLPRSRFVTSPLAAPARELGAVVDGDSIRRRAFGSARTLRGPERDRLREGRNSRCPVVLARCGFLQQHRGCFLLLVEHRADPG